MTDGSHGWGSRPVVWLVAAGAMLPLALGALLLGLVLPSLALVYLSILCSVMWLPLLVVGLIQVVSARRTAT